MAQVPTHPGNQQQGLGAPQAAPAQNPYYKPSLALSAHNDELSGAREAELAQVAQASAQAGKARAETDILRGLGAIGQQAQQAQQMQAGPTVTPEEVQIGQVTDGLVRGQLNQEQLVQMVQSGNISPEAAQAAMGRAQEFIMKDQARNEAAMGLGGL